MKKGHVAVMALALAFVGVANGQVQQKSQTYADSMRQFEKFVQQFPSPQETRPLDFKPYTDALATYEHYTKTYEQALERFQKAFAMYQTALEQYQQFLDSFPANR